MAGRFHSWFGIARSSKTCFLMIVLTVFFFRSTWAYGSSKTNSRPRGRLPDAAGRRCTRGTARTASSRWRWSSVPRCEWLLAGTPGSWGVVLFHLHKCANTTTHTRTQGHKSTHTHKYKHTHERATVFLSSTIIFFLFKQGDKQICQRSGHPIQFLV